MSIRALILRLTVLIALAFVTSRVMAAEPLSAEAAQAWGFDRSGLAPHPEVRWGVLPNGMRTAIMRNADPAGALSVRLYLGGGALLEGPKEQGFMHLIEHMIFQGTEALPKGSLPLFLAHDGLRRWSDFDAETTYDHTLYRLDLGRSDERARTTALTLMREIATNLVFSRQTVAGARKDVREEIAGRDAAQDRLMEAQNRFFLAGTPLARGPVAGSAKSIGRAKPEALQHLYQAAYRPDRAVLVVVGDVDPAVVEREIAARFSDWTAGAPPRQPMASQVSNSGSVQLFRQPKGPATLTIAVVTTIAAGDTSPERERGFLVLLADRMLDRRFAMLASQPDARFVSAAAASYDYFGTAHFSTLDLTAKGGDWRGALGVGQAVLDAAVRQGFSQAELDAVMAEQRRGASNASAPQTARATADAIADSVVRNFVFTAPASEEGGDASLAQVRIADVNAAFAQSWTRAPRLLFVAAERRVSLAEVGAAWALAKGGLAELRHVNDAPGQRLVEKAIEPAQ